MEMSPATHSYLHSFFGAQFGTGCQPGNVVKDTTNEELLKVTISEGSIADEDIKHTVKQRLITDTIDIVYNTGTNYSEPKIAAITSAPGHIFTPGVNDMAYYNEWTGSSWQLTECPEGDFILAHIFATNFIDSLDITKRKFIAVMGQEAYDKAGDGRTGANEEIARLVSTLPFPELVPIATFMIEVKAANNNTLSAKLKEVEGGGVLFVDWRNAGLVGSGGAIGSTHADLLLRDAANAHPAPAISYDPTISGLAATDVKAAIDEVEARVELDAANVQTVSSTVNLSALTPEEGWVVYVTENKKYYIYDGSDWLTIFLPTELTVDSRDTTDLTLHSSTALTGVGVKIPAATTLLSGLMTGAQKLKLDEIEAGAEVHKAPTKPEVEAVVTQKSISVIVYPFNATGIHQ